MMLAAPLVVLVLGAEYGGAGVVLNEAIGLVIPLGLAKGLNKLSSLIGDILRPFRFQVCWEVRPWWCCLSL